MGWFQDVWAWIVDQFNKITDAIRQWVVDAIDWATTQIRILVMGGRRWLAEFMTTTHGFWLTIGLLIAGTIGAAYVGEAQWFLAIKKYVEEWVEGVKNAAGLVLDWLGFTYLNTIHELALIFNEDYANWWAPIYSAFGTMSQELGLGLSTINLLARAGQQLAFLSLSVAGVPAGAAWIASESDRATFLERMEERWMRYAEDPYLVFSDIDTELVYPAVELLGDEFQRRWLILQNLNEWAQGAADDITSIHDTIDSLIQSLPEEFDIVREGIWNDISTEFTTFMETNVTPWLEKADRAVDRINQTILEQEIKVQKMLAEIAEPGSYLASILIMPEPIRTRQLNTLAYVFERAYEREMEISRPIVRDLVVRDWRNALFALTVTPEVPVERHISEIVPPAKPAPYPIPGWYVGSY